MLFILAIRYLKSLFIKIAAYTIAVGYFIESLVKSLDDIDERNK
jgi:hypothetical protein